MATASNVQREPSMEEILASIRRIIEDSDSGRKPTESFTDGGIEAEARDEPEAAPAVVDVFRTELRSGTGSFSLTPEASTPEMSRPGSRSDSAAGASRVDGREAEGSAPANPDSTFTRIDFTRSESARPSRETVQKPAETAGDRHVPADTLPTRGGRDDVGPDLARQPDRLADVVPQPESAVERKQQVESTTLATATPALSAENSEAAAKPVLVSEKTSRQVAAAFEELSGAFAARSKKSLDDMAEEMLRPMLQEWLDNNLPTLVEKLVREEIERVARGA
ncbi:hypothetical protein BG36_17170 [Aquamicrobium defluvii]|uniref:DUF2497 domain-containing protein n=2 Tax=Aquamicrobium defluvii TaxID=69279 RepID=A0A011U758_9HYPH|nr:hypothetical protein BG36_17170 [Aquamicrobium defluvii]EZQ12809.1 hypothetical protein CF98_34275 [Halopseudomonas bauzanensis]TDR31475.1 hypothetical protein DES43_13339 [Aquamicrobium defluvii]